MARSLGPRESRSHHVVRYGRLWALDLRAPDPLGPDAGPAVGVVVPVGPDDIDLVPLVLEGLERHLRHPLDRVVCVAPAELVGQVEARAGCRVLADEAVLGDDVVALARDLYGGRSGWMVQQLVKLALPELVDGPYGFVIDADTVLVRPRTFSDGRRALLLASREFNPAYYRTLSRLGQLENGTPRLSFVAHHMWFDVEQLATRRTEIERHSGMRWTESILRVAHEPEPGVQATFSEYELYGQARAAAPPGATVIRSLRNRPLARTTGITLADLQVAASHRDYSVSLHHYLGPS